MCIKALVFGTSINRFIEYRCLKTLRSARNVAEDKIRRNRGSVRSIQGRYYQYSIANIYVYIPTAVKKTAPIENSCMAGLHSKRLPIAAMEHSIAG